MLDTGSPVSFLNNSSYNKYFELQSNSLEKPNKKFHTVTDQPIELKDEIQIVISIDALLGREFPVKLLVMTKDYLQVEMILGRDFLEALALTLAYRPIFEPEAMM